jgi:hypothetical protein
VVSAADPLRSLISVFYLLLNALCLFTDGTGVELSPLLLRPFTGLLYRPWMIDGDDCGAISGLNEWRLLGCYAVWFL